MLQCLYSSMVTGSCSTATLIGLLPFRIYRVFKLSSVSLLLIASAVAIVFTPWYQFLSRPLAFEDFPR